MDVPTAIALYQFAAIYDQLEPLKKRSDLNSDEARLRTDLERQLSGLATRDDVTPLNASSAAILVAEQNGRISKILELIDQAWKKDLESEHGYSDWRYIVATAITRVGVVLIIVFLVQILMGLYRYNTRLMTYYNSRRDLIALWEGKAEGLKVLDHVLSPPNIDFGKDPKHPLEDIIRAVAATVAGRGKAKQETKPTQS